MTYCIKKIVVKKPFIISLSPKHTMIEYTDFTQKNIQIEWEIPH